MREPDIIDVVGQYRQTFTTGAVTTIAAGTATAGHMLALRMATASKAIRFRKLEVEFILTTAFGAPQEVGFDAFVARSYSVAHSGETALSVGANDGKIRTQHADEVLTGRISNTGALTAGTHTLDGGAIARGSCWAGAIGAQLGPRTYDLSVNFGGIIVQNNEGIVVRNTVLMGATGVGKWHFTFEFDLVILGN
jgi:hypothetical protein